MSTSENVPATTCSLGEALLDDTVEETTVVVEPLALLDFAITIGIEGGEELIHLGTPQILRESVVGKTATLDSQLPNFASIDFSVAVKVELIELFLGCCESSSSGSGDVCLLFFGKVLNHFLFNFDLSFQF